MSAGQATPQIQDTRGAEKAREQTLWSQFGRKEPTEKRSSGHITGFSEEDMGFIGRKKSIHNLLTEGFSVRARARANICYISLFLDMCITML